MAGQKQEAATHRRPPGGTSSPSTDDRYPAAARLQGSSPLMRNKTVQCIDNAPVCSYNNRKTLYRCPTRRTHGSVGIHPRITKEGRFMATTNITIRMDEELKKQAEELFADLGLSMTTAFLAFTKQAVREQRIPFNLSRNVPNARTVAALEEVEKMKLHPQDYKGYDDVDEMMKHLLT